MSKVTHIADGDLLEYSSEGHIISAQEWNNVMNTIKTAINNNAANSSSSNSSGSITINIRGSAWYVEPGDTSGSFTYTIPYSAHNIPNPLKVTIYNENGEEVYGVASVDLTTDKPDITLKSRIANKTLVALIQKV
jgi:hypothetical protein